MDESDPLEGAPKPSRQEPIAPTDELAGSVTQWLGGLKAGDDQALQPLWDRYYAALVERARTKLNALRSATAAKDEEDMAASAFQSLYDGVRAGRFPRLEDRDDLWRLLVHLTACKSIDSHRAESRQKRGGGRVFNEADMRAGHTGDQDQGNPLDRIIGTEPSPDFAAMVAEEYVRKLDALEDRSLRGIAELKLACYSNDEIRQRLGCSLRTVTLKLELIRKKWQLSLETS